MTSGLYPMYYVALVADRNNIARARVQGAYVTPTPTAFFDGGFNCMMGGFPTGGGSLVPYYEPEISEAALREVPNLDFLTSLEWLGNNQVRVHVALGHAVAANSAPSSPSLAPSGGRVKPAQTVEFTSVSTDPDANGLLYQWDWGDGQVSDWLGPFASGTSATASHAWTNQAGYEVRVKVKDPFGEETAWSDPAAITVACCMGRTGDVNDSGEDEPTIGDVSKLIDALFITGNTSILTCMTEADVNQSGGADPKATDVTIGDISVLIDYLFITGPSLGLRNCL
jgi:PKD domain